MNKETMIALTTCGNDADASALARALVERREAAASRTAEAAADAQITTSAPAPYWQDIDRPAPVYAVDAPELRALPAGFVARTNAARVREDILSAGAFEDLDAAYLQVGIRRGGQPEPHEASLFVDLARQASDLTGLAVLRSSPSAALPTKFGIAEAADLLLADASERSCLGFRFAHREMGFRLGGWLCPARGQVPDRRELVCLIDRLSLAEGVDDPDLKKLFAEAGRRRRDDCPSSTTRAPQVAAAKPANRPPPRHAKVQAERRSAAARKTSPRRAPAVIGSGRPSPEGRG